MSKSFLALPFVWLAGAAAPFVWAWKYHVATDRDKDALRAAAVFGWRYMADNAREAWRADRRWHKIMNLITEWTRLDPQRAQKVFALVAWLAFALGLLTGSTWL